MNAVAATIERPETSIVALVEANPVMVLTDREQFSRFYQEIKRETDALDADVSTEKGRKAIASMAYKVARTKTAIDEAGKKLNEEARARINAVDESRREIRQQLDALRDEVRQPLTEWEEAEETRVEACQRALELLRSSASVGIEEALSDVRERLAVVEAMPLDEQTLQGYFQQATALRDQAITSLTAAVQRIEREEAERAELERLRAEAAERERQEAERAAAEEAERQRAEAEKAEAERKARAEAEEKARIEAAAKAAEEAARAEAERSHAEELAKLQRERDEAEAARQAEASRIAREEAERKAEAERVAAEQAKREADQAHRSTILRAVKEAVMEAGQIEEATAKSIVLAIAAGNVPHTRISF